MVLFLPVIVSINFNREKDGAIIPIGDIELNIVVDKVAIVTIFNDFVALKPNIAVVLKEDNSFSSAAIIVGT